MSGLEVPLAIATIVSACAAVTSLVVQRRRDKRKGNDSKDATRLEVSLSEIMRLAHGIPTCGLGGYSRVNAISAQESLWLAWSLLYALEADLLHLDFHQNLSHFNDVAERSLALTSTSARQLGATHHSLPASSSITSSSLVSSSMALSTRTQANIHDVCHHALLYRDNVHAFEHLTQPLRAGDRPTWTCSKCSRRLTQIMLILSESNDDNIWIDACGMMKAHCTKERGEVGWTCIWKKVSRHCYLKFAHEQDLLKHMRDCHVSGYASGSVMIDWPADSRAWDAKTCGYGATIGGRTMRDADDVFRVG